MTARWKLVAVAGGFVPAPADRPPLRFTPAVAPQPSAAPVGGLTDFLSFADRQLPLTRALAGFLVDVELDRGGFRIGGRTVTPRRLGAMLADRHDGRPVILRLSGRQPVDAALEMMAGALSDAVGAPVIAADAPVVLTPAGLARTAGSFRRFHPGQPGRPRHVDRIGPLLPPPARPGSVKPVEDPVLAGAPATARPPAVAVAPAAVVATAPVPVVAVASVAVVAAAAVAVPLALPPATAAPMPEPARPPLPAPVPAEALPVAEALVVMPVDGELVALLRQGIPDMPAVLPVAPVARIPEPESEAVEGPAAEHARPVAVAEGREEAPAAFWLPESGEVEADRTALRRVLGNRYDSHARIVSRTLSENPGLRAVAGSAGGITAGLVAVRAYLLDNHAVLNAALRGEAEPDERTALVAEAARFGLGRLPPVFGPVFRSVPGAALGYQPGEELVEPAFVDVVLGELDPAQVGIEFAIWSASAHRLDGLGAGEGAALFPPGSRFSVLAVDEPDEQGAPVRVLLRDLAASRRGRGGRGGNDSAERVLDRLRSTKRPKGPARPPSAQMTFPIGMDRNGRRYRLPVAVVEGEKT